MSLKIIPLLMLGFLSASANSIDKSIDITKESLKKSQDSQKKVDSLSQKQSRLYDRYVMLSKTLEQQKIYNVHLSSIIHAQEIRLPELQAQINNINQMQGHLLPLMFEMVQTLEAFLQADTPFLREERLNRLKSIKKRLSDPEHSLTEQFRSIFDSYKIEYQYARTLESYRATLTLENNQTKTVDFLRLGRVALYYQTLDQEQSAIYIPATKKWQILDKRENAPLNKAIKMARKKISPDFLSLMIPATKGKK